MEEENKPPIEDDNLEESPKEEPRDRFRRLLNESEEEKNNNPDWTSEYLVEREEDQENDLEDKTSIPPIESENKEKGSEPNPPAFLEEDVKEDTSVEDIPLEINSKSGNESQQLTPKKAHPSMPDDTHVMAAKKQQGDEEVDEDADSPTLLEDRSFNERPTEIMVESGGVEKIIKEESGPSLESTPQPPPPLGDAPKISPPKVDTQGMPLPRRVPEVDLSATQVVVSRKVGIQNRRRPGFTESLKKKQGGMSSLGCFVRIGVWALFGLILLAGGIFSYMLLQYYSIRATLPSVDELSAKASQFETTRILDSNDNLLYEILDPNAGRRTYVSIDEISPYMIASIIATEDGAFYSHPGFNWLAIVRAFIQNTRSGETVSGASTITQQVARMLVLDADEAAQRTYMRKVREALLAMEITRVYSKDEILELYLNEVNFGNLAYGVEAAAETYFGSSANELTMAESSFLAGIPQAPAVYDVYSNPEAIFSRQQDVLRLMYETSQDQDCIYVSNSDQKICVSSDDAAKAAYEFVDYEFNAPDVKIRYPHWVNYIRSLLEKQYDPQTIYRSGFTVETTLDPGLQDMALASVQKHVFGLSNLNVQSGALVAIDPETGEILVMVGSADFYNEEIDGQINMAISPRQPGSSIKPFTYLAAFENGWTPSTLIWDVPSEFTPSGLENDPYEPVNYDERFHGPQTVRSALANSFNVPAVKALQYIGVYGESDTEGEDGLVEMAHRLGITDLKEDYYGLSLTLGGGEVQLLDMTSAYAVLGNAGNKIPPYAITRITDHNGNIVFEHEDPAGEQVIKAEHAFLISSILSDNSARTPSFGPNSVINLGFQAAAKTGTTNDFRDNWTIGYTPDLAVGVWVGNPDYTMMEGTSGLSGAAPIWAEFMKLAIQDLTGNHPTPFMKPAGVVDRVICSISGTIPSQYCPEHRSEFFASGELPLDEDEDLWQKVLVDTWTSLIASQDCPDFTEQEFTLNVSEIWAREWILDSSAGKDWAEENGFSDPVIFTPDRECKATDPRPHLAFSSPSSGSIITSSILPIVVKADADNGFKEVILEWGKGDNPHDWKQLTKITSPMPNPEEVYQWDLKDLEAGEVTLRLWMNGKDDKGYAFTLLHLDLQVPTPTPTPTSTPTETPTPTITPTVTMTVVQTATPTPTGTLTPTISLTP